MGVVVIVIHCAGKKRFPIAQGQEQLLIVVAGIIAGVDVDEAELAGICALVQIVHSHGMRVVPSRSSRTGLESQTVPTVWGHQRRTFLFRAVHLGGNEHAVPMDKLRRIGFVDYIHRYRLALPHAQHRARRRAVIADGR